MKSGQVLTDRRYKWFEPEYWRFGEAAGAEGQINYMRHASGQIYGLSGPVAKYIGRNGPILHRFANEDVTLGAWLVGLEITHVDERRLCCDSAEKCNAQVRFGPANLAVMHTSARLGAPTGCAVFCAWVHACCSSFHSVSCVCCLGSPEGCHHLSFCIAVKSGGPLFQGRGRGETGRIQRVPSFHFCAYAVFQFPCVWLCSLPAINKV